MSPYDKWLRERYPDRWIDMPIDHFHNDTTYEPHANNTFRLRYWVEPAYYKPGGPVILLQGGETSGVDRLPILHKGIVKILAEATGGVGVVFEHRYYGKSIPTENFSTENLRFLSTDQALADMAYFAKHAEFEGLPSLTAPDTAYIAYGGSYAGALVAFLRKLYPDVYWGAISSSGVTAAIWDYWEYFEAARLFAPTECVEATQTLTHFIDTILISKSSTDLPRRLKSMFGLANLSSDADFASTLTGGISQLQNTNWDPSINSTEFGHYCANLTSPSLIHPSLAPLHPEAQSLLAAAGHPAALTTSLLNYIGYVNATAVSRCNTTTPGRTQDSCFGASNPDDHARSDTAQTWRLWAYQYCTEWGYLATGAGVPSTQLPLISRLITLDHQSTVCREAFNVSSPPNVESINKHGGFNISYPRLAIVDGEKDPWKAATPHRSGLVERKSTVDEPFILIEGGVHHWDENGVLEGERGPGMPPVPVVAAQEAEVEFVKSWMAQWKRKRGRHGDL